MGLIAHAALNAVVAGVAIAAALDGNPWHLPAIPAAAAASWACLTPALKDCSE